MVEARSRGEEGGGRGGGFVKEGRIYTNTYIYVHILGRASWREGEEEGGVCESIFDVS